MYENYFQRYFRYNNCQRSLTTCLSSQFFSADNVKRSRLKKIKVLLVDDHRMMRLSLRRVIEKHDDIVISGEASDGKEGVKLARKIRPDIIIMDVNMPVMNGIEATRKISKSSSQVRIIGLSMNDGDTIIEQMKSAGASAYLHKSEVFETLIKTIRDEASAV